jgi:hypothetical protein
MDEPRAREILGIPNGSDHLNDGRNVDWIRWPRHGDRDVVLLDGDFTADDLEAIAWWMRNKEPD